VCSVLLIMLFQGVSLVECRWAYKVRPLDEGLLTSTCTDLRAASRGRCCRLPGIGSGLYSVDVTRVSDVELVLVVCRGTYVWCVRVATGSVRH
jgi:hypothetical protein